MSKKLIAGAGVVASFAIALAPLATFADEATNPSDRHTDEFVITLEPSCTFGDAIQTPAVTGVSHTEVTDTTWTTAATGTVPTGAADYTTASAPSGSSDLDSTGYGIIADEGATTSSNLNDSQHTAYRTMQAGTTVAGFAKTTLKVVCTNTEGYTVKAATNDLTRVGGSETIPALNGTAGQTKAASYSTTASGYDLDSITASNGTSSASDVVPGAETFYANATAGTAEPIVKHTGVSADNGDTIDIIYGIGIKSNQKAGTYTGKVIYTLFQGITTNG